MSILPNPENYITDSPFKTKQKIYTLEYQNKTKTTFTSPAGFQYDKFFITMFPNYDICFTADLITVKENNQIICQITVKDVE